MKTELYISLEKIEEIFQNRVVKLHKSIDNNDNYHKDGCRNPSTKDFHENINIRKEEMALNLMMNDIKSKAFSLKELSEELNSVNKNIDCSCDECVCGSKQNNSVQTDRLHPKKDYNIKL